MLKFSLLCFLPLYLGLAPSCCLLSICESRFYTSKLCLGDLLLLVSLRNEIFVLGSLNVCRFALSFNALLQRSTSDF